MDDYVQHDKLNEYERMKRKLTDMNVFILNERETEMIKGMISSEVSQAQSFWNFRKSR